MDLLNGYLNEDIKITKIQDHTVAGTSTIVSDEIDMLGYDGVLFLTSLSVAATNNIATMTQGASGAEAATVALITSGASDEDLVLDVRPDPANGRYVKLSVARGTSTTIESIWAIQYKGKNRPVTNALSGTLTLAQFNGPALA